MSLEECCKLFRISNINDVDKKLLKKTYHKLCLKYHPDKNDHGEEEFIKIKLCYDKLNKILETKQEDESCNKNNYEILFNGINTIKHVLNYLERCHHLLNNYPEVVYLDVQIEQVVNKCLYTTPDGHHIPLWHKFFSHYSERDKKYFIFIIRIIELPSNVHISGNNDILIEIPYHAFQYGTVKHVKLCNTSHYSFLVTEECIKEGHIILFRKGIPRIKRENVYDTSELSNVRIYWK